MSTTQDKPFALFLTWTTYGTWLPGDKRGYVSNTLQADETYQKKENRLGVPYEKNDPTTLAQSKKLLRGNPVFLTKSQAEIVAEEISKSAVKRQWMVLRAAIMSKMFMFSSQIALMTRRKFNVSSKEHHRQPFHDSPVSRNAGGLSEAVNVICMKSKRSILQPVISNDKNRFWRSFARIE